MHVPHHCRAPVKEAGCPTCAVITVICSRRGDSIVRVIASERGVWRSGLVDLERCPNLRKPILRDLDLKEGVLPGRHNRTNCWSGTVSSEIGW